MEKGILIKKNVLFVNIIIEGREDLILRGQLYISDNAEPISPVSSPR
tara:strand:- start:37 stop:177 length:141 start_codon:yes stop_codon:yes gene_type:complete